MNKALVNYLEQLDLSETESKLYAALLEFGTTTVRELAIKTGVGRTSAYPYIDILIEKGLVVKIVKNPHTYIAVNQPIKMLQHLLEEKAQGVNDVKEKFLEIEKMIDAMLPRSNAIEKPEIKYYKGRFGIRKIYEDALQTKELRGYANFITGLTFPEIETMYLQAFKENPNLIMYELLGDTPASRKQPFLHGKRYFRKYIPSFVKLSTTDILIFDGKVCIINFDDIPVGTVLQNHDYYIHTKGMFDYFWGTLPEVNK